MLVTANTVFAVSVVLLYANTTYVVQAAADPQTYLFVRPKSRDDNLNVRGDDLRMTRLYGSVLDLLLYKMKTWTNSVSSSSAAAAAGAAVDPESAVAPISKYLGFPVETIRLINDAMTELVFRHVKNRLRVSNLAAAFFYSCDLEHMRDPDADRVANVKENFEMIFENFGIGADYAAVAAAADEGELVEQLRRSLTGVGRLLDCWFRVSVDLMKNRLFVGRRRSTNATVDRLRHRLRDYDDDKMSSHERETNLNAVVKNHLEVIGKVVPDLFGFAYNHVELLTRLRTFDGPAADDSAAASSSDAPVLRSADVLPLVVTIFLHRYFELKNADVEEPVKTDIFRFLDFFDPSVEYAGRPVCIADYRSTHPKYDFDRRMWHWTDTALRRILQQTGSRETPEQWTRNRTIRIDYGPAAEAAVDRNRILALMEANTAAAVEFLAEIKRNCGLLDDDDDDDDGGGGGAGDGDYARIRKSITSREQE